MLPQARRAGDDHLRGDLPGLLVPAPPTPGQQAGPAQYGFTITLAAAEVPALTAVTTTAADAQGPLAISAAGRTWVLPIVGSPFTGPRLLVPLPTENQALQLQRILASSG